jgi:hypothetical protein
MTERPPLPAVSQALAAARARDPTCTWFTVGRMEYRLATMPNEPPLEWTVWAGSIAGDIVVEKASGRLVRPAQTMNEGYRVVSIAKATPFRGDRYLRRRVHEWIAHAFLGPPPTPDAIVEHLNDQGGTNDAINLIWSTSSTNRKRKTANDRAGLAPDGKVRKLPLSLNLVRQLQQRTGCRGQTLIAHVEDLIARELDARATRT